MSNQNRKIRLSSKGQVVGSHFFIWTLALGLLGCASVEKLESSPECHVWENQKVVGPSYPVKVKDNKARYEYSCSLPGFLCSWIETEIVDGRQMTIESNGIFGSKKPVGTLQGNTFTYVKAGELIEKLGSTSPVEFNMTSKTVKRTVTSSLLNKSADEALQFNGACTLQQAAAGAVLIWAAKNTGR